MRRYRFLETALVGKGFRLQDIRAMTMPQIESYVAVLSGKAPMGGSGRRFVPARRKGQ
ncbi:hypothetical protein JCM15519_03850 [Fundidesulfovibrio butyratiphilus]